MVVPMASNCCDALFCKSCISSALARSPACPQCRAAMPSLQTSLREADRTWKRLLGELPVFCSLKEVGCKWEGPRSNLDEHLESFCEHHGCPNSGRGCAWRGKKGQLPTHLPMCPEGELKARREKLQAQLRAINPINQGALALNVGGASFLVSLATIQQYPASMLATLIDGTLELHKDDKGSVVIDRDPHAFMLLTRALRSYSLKELSRG